MRDESKEAEDVKVVDRRRFTAAGERRPETDISPPPEPPPPSPAQPDPAAAGAGTESAAARSARQAYDRQRPPRDYKVDFETLVMSLSTSAMYQLGLVEDPARGAIPADLEAARHTIDMLAVIQEKTRGNLSPREQQLLEQVLYELRLAYLSLTSGPKPGSPKAGA
ncbi:MAG: DUF1844 domain-containing protein [Acidobacteria bacterium]|nr:DUF1844 domain-containing protein [Acidobacteriota bacterium]